MVEEIWKQVVIDNEEWPYEVSNIGRVRRSKSTNKQARNTYVGYVLKLKETKDGYLEVCLRDKPRVRYVRAHKIVAEAFLGRRPNGMVINHKNCNKRDNRPENLEYVTVKQNTRHALENELWDNRLTKDSIIDIYKKSWDNQFTTKEIANQYNISSKHVCNIRNQVRCKWVTEGINAHNNG